MDAVSATHVARPFHVLITNEGTHSARKWAALTATLLMEAKIDAMPEAIVRIAALKVKVEHILFDVFNEVKASTSTTDIVVLVNQAIERIVYAASDTKWAATFAAAPIKEAMRELILRNLASANEIALRTE